MIIAYYSLTGNVRRFVHKLGKPGLLHEIIDPAEMITEDFVLITPTVGFGRVPPSVAEFVENNADHIKAVAASGNLNWGGNYAAAGRIISEQYGVPLLMTFELSGTVADVAEFIRKYEGVLRN